eukprot:TRINITY_DN8963_c0_g1_i1.p1 TRINITY_DN8963_c0_g1~~TRINITY_DN8963_c0_g1_i1.p1  ORF type:complete len:201 (+),score=22.47 TRINITY_DN8963_c0_g1_i1:53-655(+)
MKADSIAEESKKVEVLYQDILERVQKLIEIEHLEQDEKVTTEGSKWYNDALGMGFHVFAFYMCHMCTNPFFGGRRECEPNAEAEVKPDEIICTSCSDLAGKNCGKPEHSDFVMWKCRFCCNMATWFCWGSTHFCEFCHSNDPWGRAKGTASGQAERATCAGPGKCSIVLPHKNGIDQDCELCLGCGQCMGAVSKKSSILP